LFTATCPSCGRASVYSYTDLRDVKLVTTNEYLQQPEGRLPLLLRLLVEDVMLAYGIMQVQEGIVYTLRRIREELGRRH
jgi:hypothetical protein